MMYVASCLILVAVASVQCADVSTDNAAPVSIGRNKSPGYQCRALGYGGICEAVDPATRCSELICADTESYDIPAPRETGKPALDGTWCGDEKICFEGKCVDDTEPPANPLKIKDFQYGCEKLWW